MVQTTLTQPILANLKNLPYGGAEAVVNKDMSEEVIQIIRETSNEFYNKDCQQNFIDTYINWIKSTKNNTISGLDKFPVVAVSQGTTEAFDKFYLEHHTRRFRCFRGEYMYHAASWKNFFNWSYLEDEPLTANDAIVVSHPFSNSGNTHPELWKKLDLAEKLKVPVLIDAAFFGIVGGMHFELSHPAVNTVTFSLSKTFPVAHLRIGLRLTRSDNDDSLLVSNKTQYINRLSCLVGTALMNNYSPDYQFNTYRDTQIKLCKKLSLIPSSTIIFGIDIENKYPEYNRNTYENRLCIARYLHSATLPND